MDHVVYLDARVKELENLISGNKSMIIRAAAEKKLPHGEVNKGDILYFISDNSKTEVKARGKVSSVMNFERLSVEESFETIINYQDKLQLPDQQFETLAGKSFLVLIELHEIMEISPFHINQYSHSLSDDWITVANIQSIVLNNPEQSESGSNAGSI
jgi:ASC-1-like (ASCH) protein